jgi:hypothetical protein
LVDLELEGEDLMGGLLQVIILVKNPRRGILSVHLSASTGHEDPKVEAEEKDDKIEEFIKNASQRWNSHAYQREIFGGQTWETYL